MIKRLLLVLLFVDGHDRPARRPPTGGEYIMLVGGPSMYQWEKYKGFPARSLVGELCASGAFAH
jgi:hypothetical protein